MTSRMGRPVINLLPKEPDGAVATPTDPPLPAFLLFFPVFQRNVSEETRQHP